MDLGRFLHVVWYPGRMFLGVFMATVSEYYWIDCLGFGRIIASFLGCVGVCFFKEVRFVFFPRAFGI